MCTPRTLPAHPGPVSWATSPRDPGRLRRRGRARGRRGRPGDRPRSPPRSSRPRTPGRGGARPPRPPPRALTPGSRRRCRTARSMVSALPARVPSGSRGAPSTSASSIPPDAAGPPGHGVGDEHEPVGRLGAEGDRERGGVDVDQVGDQRHRHPVVGEGGADEAGLAVVQAGHAVEAVGDEPGAGVDRRRRHARTCAAEWPRATGMPRAGRVLDRLERAARLRGARVTRPTGRAEPEHPVGVGRADQVDRVGARADRRGTGPRGGRRRSTGRRRRVAAAPAMRARASGVAVERRGHQGRAPGRDALGRRAGRRGGPSRRRRRGPRRRRRCR